MFKAVITLFLLQYSVIFQEISSGSIEQAVDPKPLLPICLYALLRVCNNGTDALHSPLLLKSRGIWHAAC